MKKKTAIVLLIVLTIGIDAQPYPDSFVGGHFLATYGNMSRFESVEGDHSQSIFFAIPIDLKTEFFIRVYDPDCGGNLDHLNGLWETNTIFEVYGGPGCLSNKDSRSGNESGDYKAGTLLERQLFARESAVDGSWVAFGPFNVDQGEKVESFADHRFFKVIVEGRTGNDVNLFALYISSSDSQNLSIPNTRTFQYALTYFDEGSFNISSKSSEFASSSEIILPIELPALQKSSSVEIVAEPLEE